MILFKLLNAILILMCLGLCASLLWIPYEFQDVLKTEHTMIFLVLAGISLTPIGYMIHQHRKKT